MLKKNLLILNLVCGLAALGADSIGLELLPKGRPFRLTFADPREIRMALSVEGDQRIDATIGNYFSIFALRPAGENPEWFAHFGLEGAGYFTMRHADRRFPLETADGLIGVYFEGASGPLQLQLRYTHISAHLADGSTASPIAYSREFLTFRAGYVPTPDLQFYTGIQYLANTTPVVNPWAFQMGANFFVPLNYSLVPFFGGDLKWKEESDHNPNFSFVIGAALNNPPEAFRSFRFYYQYYTGSDARGQYYQSLLTYHSLGIEMQI